MSVLDVDPVVHDFADRVASRGERAADVQHVVTQVGDSPPDLLRCPVLDVVVELLDLVVMVSTRSR